MAKKLSTNQARILETLRDGGTVERHRFPSSHTKIAFLGKPGERLQPLTDRVWDGLQAYLRYEGQQTFHNELMVDTYVASVEGLRALSDHLTKVQHRGVRALTKGK
jgi:hypothetical protein